LLVLFVTVFGDEIKVGFGESADALARDASVAGE